MSETYSPDKYMKDTITIDKIDYLLRQNNIYEKILVSQTVTNNFSEAIDEIVRLHRDRADLVEKLYTSGSLQHVRYEDGNNPFKDDGQIKVQAEQDFIDNANNLCSLVEEYSINQEINELNNLLSEVYNAQYATVLQRNHAKNCMQDEQIRIVTYNNNHQIPAEETYSELARLEASFEPVFNQLEVLDGKYREKITEIESRMSQLSGGKTFGSRKTYDYNSKRVEDVKRFDDMSKYISGDLALNLELKGDLIYYGTAYVDGKPVNLYFDNGDHDETYKNSNFFKKYDASRLFTIVNGEKCYITNNKDIRSNSDTRGWFEFNYDVSIPIDENGNPTSEETYENWNRWFDSSFYYKDPNGGVHEFSPDDINNNTRLDVSSINGFYTPSQVNTNNNSDSEESESGRVSSGGMHHSGRSGRA